MEKRRSPAYSNNPGVISHVMLQRPKAQTSIVGRFAVAATGGLTAGFLAGMLALGSTSSPSEATAMEGRSDGAFHEAKGSMVNVVGDAQVVEVVAEAKTSPTKRETGGKATAKAASPDETGQSPRKGRHPRAESLGTSMALEQGQSGEMEPEKLEKTEAGGGADEGRQVAKLTFKVTSPNGGEGVVIQVDGAPVNGDSFAVMLSAGESRQVKIVATKTGFVPFRRNVIVSGDQEVSIVLVRRHREGKDKSKGPSGLISL